MAQQSTQKTEAESSRWPFGKKNYVLFAAAIFATVLGFILLGAGDITWAPILLVLGYCVLMPMAIIIRDRKDESEPTESPAE